MKRILIADDVHPSLFGYLDSLGFSYDYEPILNRPEILSKISTYEGLVIRSKTRVDAEFLSAATRLEFIARAGAGLDLIDEDIAQQRNIRVFAANEGNRDAVAEHCLGMLLSLFNHLNQADAQVRQRRWLREENRGIELGGRTIGLIGYGNNGSALAQKLSGFNVRVLAYDPYKTGFSAGHVREATMDELFAEADVLSLHVPLTDETHGLVDAAFLARFAKPIFLLNAARGEIVVLADLLAALESGRVLGAGLDVLENEKLDRLTPEQNAVFEALAQRPNVLFSPHVAGWTVESYERISRVLGEKIRSYQIQYRIQQLVEKALREGSQNEWIQLNTLTEAEEKRLQKLIGHHLNGSQRILDVASIRHTMKRHGNALTESQRGQVAVREQDFELIPVIVTQFDRIYAGTPNARGLETIIYEKQIEDLFYYVEEVRLGRKKLCLNTLYKRKSR
jgi:D-3-phosphoglycerate dehydrogenase